MTQRVKLEEIALAEPQELMALIQEGVRDQGIWVSQRWRWCELLGLHFMHMKQILFLNPPLDTYTALAALTQKERRCMLKAEATAHASPHDQVTTVRTIRAEIHDHEPRRVLQHRLRILPQELRGQLLNVLLKEPLSKLRFVLRGSRGGRCDMLQDLPVTTPIFYYCSFKKKNRIENYTNRHNQKTRNNYPIK